MKNSEFNNQLIELKEKLMRYAFQLTTDKDDAKDLLQDTFLKALMCRDQFVDSTNLKAWAYTIMKNTFINNYRRHSRQNTTFDNTKDLFFLSQNKDTFNVEPDSVFQEKEINRAIERLDSEFKVPFRMHTEGFKYKEIADILGLKIGTVKSRIHFTRKKLLKTIEN